MKTLISTLILMFVSILSFSQNQEALKSMRTGKFTYLGQEGKVEIIRTATEQTEIYNNGQSKGVLDINWISDTEYTLTLRIAENAPGCVKVGEVITAKILNCEGNKYYYESNSESCGEDSNTIVKIE